MSQDGVRAEEQRDFRRRAGEHAAKYDRTDRSTEPGTGLKAPAVGLGREAAAARREPAG